jgi:hypothetical protein
MHRDLVEKRKWISEEDYKEGLTLAQLAPGPLAAQLGIYLGFVHYRYMGAPWSALRLYFRLFYGSSFRHLYKCIMVFPGCRLYFMEWELR